MPENCALLAAAASTTVGLSWVALAMEAHWGEVRPGRPLTGGTASALRVMGALALGLSLYLCLRADHPSIAALVWIMMLAAGALAVAFALAWHPRALAPLTAWLPA